MRVSDTQANLTKLSVLGRIVPRKSILHLGFLRLSWNHLAHGAVLITSKEQSITHLRLAITPPPSTELTSLQPGLSRSSMLLAWRGCPALTGIRTTLSPTTTWKSEIKCNLDLCNYPIKWSNVTFLENDSNACSGNGTWWIYLQIIHTPALFTHASAIAWVQDFYTNESSHSQMPPCSGETWDHEIDMNICKFQEQFSSSKLH